MKTFIDDPRVPQVPTGYTVEVDPDTGVYTAHAPEDKRKSKGRVPAKPVVFSLMENARGELFWVPENDYPTRPIREFAIAQGLDLEVRIPGMRMTHKAPKCSTILRQEYGMKGTPEKLLKEFLEFRQIELHPPKGVLAMKEARP